MTTLGFSTENFGLSIAVRVKSLTIPEELNAFYLVELVTCVPKDLLPFSSIGGTGRIRVPA